MTLEEFVRQHRMEIEQHVRSVPGCENLGPLDDDDLEQWVENDESLWLWAQSEGVQDPE
jgi:hypothetical protein